MDAETAVSLQEEYKALLQEVVDGCVQLASKLDNLHFTREPFDTGKMEAVIAKLTNQLIWLRDHFTPMPKEDKVDGEVPSVKRPRLM